LIQALWILRILHSFIEGGRLGIVASIMGGEMKGREIGLNLRGNPLLTYFLLKDPNKMSHPDSSVIPFSQPLGEVIINSFMEFFVFLNLMIGLGEGTTTSTAKGTERKTLFLGKGQVTRCHQEISIMVNRFNRVTAATEFWNVGEMNPQPVRHFPGRDLVIDGPHRDSASQE
jgi:hypothetical protein